MLVKLMLSHQQVISLKFPGIAKWSDAIFPPPGHDGHGGQEKYQKPKFPLEYLLYRQTYGFLLSS